MKKILLVALFFSPALIMTAQNRTITGKITSSENKPVSFATIAVKGTSTAVSADENGSFSIQAPANTVLVFSAVGFQSTEINIGSRTNISVSLSNRGALSEVVVTAVGITRAQKSLGYSTATIKSDELLKARETNLVNALAGKVSGVRVNSQSGTLGGSSKIIIRGANSIQDPNYGNQPLFVIDGLPTDNTGSAGLISTGGTASVNIDYGNRAGDINSDDIETITVLKGAAATALYGARAKNGAIIITTKQGKKNSKNSVTVNSSLRFDNVLKLPDFQNEYAQGNYGVYDLKYTNGWGPKISQVQDRKFKDFMGDDVTLQAYPDNVKDFFQTGKSYINNVAFAGGSDNSDYRLSLTALNETGIIPITSLDRYTISLNSGRDFSPKFSSRFSISYSNTSADGRPAQSSNNRNIITSSIYGLPRVVDINKLRDNYINPVTGQQNFLSTDKDGNNPFWIMNFNRTKNNVDRTIGNFVLRFKPLEWLTFSNNFGGDFYNENRSSVVRKGSAGNQAGGFSNTNIFVRSINNDFLITAEKNEVIKGLGIKLILGHNLFERELKGDLVNASTLTIDQLYTYSNASTSTPNLLYQKRRIVGTFGDLGFNYKNFAFLNITGRNDWTSTLPIDNRSYFYPSVSGSLIFTEFTKNIPWLSYGKLRASWASVGSDEQPYQLDFLYNPTNTVFFQFLSSTTTVFPQPPIVTAFTGPRILPNQKLKPQKQNTWEIGTDIRILNNRIGLGFTYYNTVTRDQIVAIDVPPSTGYFNNNINAGAVRNKGIEVDLNVQPIKSENFTWALDINFARNKQIVEELTPQLPLYILSSGWSGLYVKAGVGETFGLYGLGWKRDPDGNFVINSANGLRETEAGKRFGDIYPKWTMGINNTFSYKGINLSGLLDIRKGGVFYSGTVGGLRASGLARETLENRDKIFIDKGVVFDAATNKYIPNTVPVQSMQDFWAWYSAIGNTEGNVFDASFVKLREIRLSYTLPSKFLGKSFIKGVEIGIEGRNILIIKDYVPHVDPELNFFGVSSIGEGVEFNSVPSARSLGINVRLSL